MPNYSLVTDARYDPFTYDELLKPVEKATTLHRATESAYGDLDVQAGEIEGLINEERDPETKKLYQGYLDKLYAARDSLNQFGLTPQTTATLQKLRGQYSRDIGSIKSAYENRAAAIKDYHANQEKANYTLITENNPEEMSLDDFLNNPTNGMGWHRSGQQIMQQTAYQAEKFAKTLREDEEAAKKFLHSIGLPYHYLHYFKHGASPEELLDWLDKEAKAEDTVAARIMNAFAGNILESTGVLGIKDPDKMYEARDKVISYIKQGMAGVLGETSPQQFTDSYSMSDALNANASARNLQNQKDYWTFVHGQHEEQIIMDKKHKLQFTQMYVGNDGQKAKEVIEGLGTTASDIYQQYKGKFNKATGVPDKSVMDDMKNENSTLRKLLGNIGGKDFNPENKDDVAQAWRRFLGSTGVDSDITSSRILRVPLSDDRSAEIKEKTIVASSTGNKSTDKQNFSIVEYKGPNEGFKRTGKTISAKDLSGDKYKIIDYVTDIFVDGNPIVWRIAEYNKDGEIAKVHYIESPTSQDADAMRNVNELRRQNREHMKMYRDSEDLEKQMKLSDESAQSTSQIQDVIMGLGRTNKMQTEMFDPYMYEYNMIYGTGAYDGSAGIDLGGMEE